MRHSIVIQCVVFDRSQIPAVLGTVVYEEQPVSPWLIDTDP